MRPSHSYTQKIGKNIFMVFLLLVYIALNIASNGKLLHITLLGFYKIIGLIVPIVPIDQLVNPFAL